MTIPHLRSRDEGRRRPPPATRSTERWPQPVAAILSCGAGNRSPESQRRLAEAMRAPETPGCRAPWGG